MAEQGLSEVVTLQRATSVNFVRQNQGLIVKVAQGEKRPAASWDPRNNTKTISDKILDDIEFTRDNIGLHLNGRMVDVDVDNENPYVFRALDAYLPHTNHIWGRASKPRSHRIYVLTSEDFDPGVYMVLRTLKRIPEVQMELRGGALSRGEYSVMPGSIHPSGEAYEWDSIASARSTPSVVDIQDLLRGIRKAAAAALMASIWQEGVRQELSMAFAGFLQRVNTMSRALSEEMFTLGFDEALEFFKTFLTVVDDDQKDRRDRIAAFKMTWKKGEDGVKVTGATRIAEVAGDKSLVTKLYNLLSDHPDMQKIEEYLQRFAIWVGPGNIIDLDGEDASGMKTVMSRTGFLNSYGYDYISVGDKKRLLSDAMFSMPATMRVNGVTFEPGAGTIVDRGRNRYINQWSGFSVEPDPNPVSKADILPFLQYVWEILCKKRLSVYKFVMAWVADIFQNPADKPGTALVFVGLPGAGKSFLGDNVLRSIIGHAHATQTNDIEQITAKHNTKIANKLFIQCDEATNSRQKSTTARLKSLITDPTNTIEPKGIDSYELPNYARYIMTSNDVEDAIYLPDGLGDRRFVVIHVSDHMVGREVQYWEGMARWCADKSNQARILRYMLDYKYDKNKIRRAITTPEKVRMIQSSWSDFDAWVIRSLMGGHPIMDQFHRQPGYSAQDLEDLPRIVTRDAWPRYANIAPMVSSYRASMHSVNSRNHAPSDGELIRHLTERGLIKPVVNTVDTTETDERSGMNRKVKYRMVELEPLEKWAKYAQDAVGFDMPTFQEVNGVKNGVANRTDF